MKKKLIVHIDCTKEYDSDHYFEIGKSRIVATQAGTYRETEHTHLARFGYRFPLNDKTKPHLLVVRYPDDRNRFMCITDDSSYDLDTGITCGGINPITGKVLEIENYFYPRWEDETVVFTTWGADYPAAVAEFWVFELDEFEPAELPEACGHAENRRMGIQYEDPCNVALSVGAHNLSEFIDHHIAFMKFSGRNHLTYPINWYHGPIVPVKCQPSSRFILSGHEDRKRYIVAKKSDISDWLEYWLERFDEEGFSFKGSMTLMRLGNLMSNMNVDEEIIKKGTDTYNNILFNGAVQQSLNDWTTVYNPIAFDSWYDSFVKGTPLKYAYGEKKGQGDELSKEVRAPLFNPLHPTVQKQVLELLGEIAGKYAKHPSFKGISVNMWHGTMLWYGNLLAGYDDVSIGMFERETGISLGIDGADPRRFEKRFLKLTMTLRDTFVRWRCKKIHEFICQCRDIIKEKREDLTLTLTVWNETSASYGYFNTVPGPMTGYGARRDFQTVYCEGGLDLNLYKHEANIEIAVENTHTRDLSENALKGEEFTNMFVDTAFMDHEITEVLSSAPNSTSFIFDSWVEMWGKTTLSECGPEDKNLADLKQLEFGDVDFVARENSTYAENPEHKFWFENQMRITSAFPAGHYLEWLANEVAKQDSLEITQGGLYMDMAHAKEQRQFARQYRMLPRCKFHTVDGASGIAVVRYLEKDGKTYIYAVNREPYEVKVDIRTEKESLKWSLAPFELKVEVFEERNIPYEYEVIIPEGMDEWYASGVSAAVADIEKSYAEGFFIAGADELRGRLMEAVRNRNYSFIRHAMKSQIINSVNSALG